MVLLHNNRTAHHANEIACACAHAGHELISINYDQTRIRVHDLIQQNDALIINTINALTTYLVLVGRRHRIMMVTLTAPSDPRQRTVNDMFENVLGVLAYRTPMEFIAWNTTTTLARNQRLVVIDEPRLLQSFAWQAFLRCVHKLPLGEHLRVIDVIKQESNGVMETHDVNPNTIKGPRQTGWVSGFRIGIYKIVAERMSAKRMHYWQTQHTVRYAVQFERLPTMRYLDTRLSLANVEKQFVLNYHLSFLVKQKIQLYTQVQPRVFRILVPRVVMENSSSNKRMIDYYRKTIVVLSLLLMAALYVVLRYCCQFAAPKNGVSFLMHSFFDTLARSLGTSSGIWLGRTTSERLLLFVIGVYSIYACSIFSGVLYEQLLIGEEVKFKYNSLHDVCDEKLALGYPYEVYNLLLQHEDYNMLK